MEVDPVPADPGDPLNPQHESYNEDSNGVSKSEKQTRTRLSDQEKSQLLEDERVKLLDQKNLPQNEKRQIMDQLKSEYGIGKTTFYKILRENRDNMSFDESYDEESNGVGTQSPDEQQSLGEAKSGEKTPGTRTRLSDLEKFQLLNDDRIKLLDQELPRGEKRLIMEQLKSEYGISKTSFYSILRDRQSFSNPDNIRGIKSRKDITGPKIELDNRLIDWIESEKRQGITVKEKEILVRAAEIGQDLGITNLNYSHGWLHRFRERAKKMEASNRELEHLKSVHVKQEHMEMAGDPFVVDVNDVNNSYVVNNRVKHNPGFYAEEEKGEEFVGDQDWDWKPDIHKHSVPKRPVPPKDMFRLKANDIAYIHKDNWTQFEDVFIMSDTGCMFGFNRCLLSSISSVCKKLLLMLYECPLANLDEVVYISSDYTETELQTLRNLLETGTLESVSEKHSVFNAIGINLENILGAFKQSLSVRPDNTYNHPFNTAPLPNDRFEDFGASEPLENKFEVKVKTEIPEILPEPESYFDDYVKNESFGDPSYLPPPQVAKPRQKLLTNKKKPKTEGDGPREIIPRNRLSNEEKLKIIEASKRPGFKLKECMAEFNIAKSSIYTILKNAGEFERKIKSPKAKPEDPREHPEMYFHFPQDEERDLSKPYQCELCVRGFFDENNYRHHAHRHTLPVKDYGQAFLCPACEKYTSRTQEGINQHRKGDCPIRRREDSFSKIYYYCAICQPGEKFKLAKDLLYHHQQLHKDTIAQNVSLDIEHCPTCGAMIGSEAILKRHFIKQGPFHKNSQCSFCPATFKTWAEHKHHLDKNHNGVFRYTCGFCGINHFKDYTMYMCHKTMCEISRATRVSEDYGDAESLQKSVSCTICHEKVLCDRISVQNHLKSTHQELAIQCEKCPGIYFTDVCMDRHMRAQHGKTFQCDQCPKKYPSGALLREHQRMHENKKEFVCAECGAAFNKRLHLNHHVRYVHQGHRSESQKGIIHGNHETVPCEQCAKSVSKAGYKAHLKACSMNKGIPCPECGSIHRHPQLLAKHIQKQHTFVTCEICGKEVKTGKLSYHMGQYHTADEDMQHRCTICGKGFHVKNRWMDHMNTHTGARPYDCMFCDKNFASHANMFKHLREAHAAQWKLHRENAKNKIK